MQTFLVSMQIFWSIGPVENLKQSERLEFSVGLTVVGYTFSLWLIRGPQNLSNNVLFMVSLIFPSISRARLGPRV